MYTKRKRIEYNEYRQRIIEKYNITVNNYNWLRRKGQALHKIYEDACNGFITYDLQYDNLVNPLYEEIDKYIKKLGLYVYHQTDPRGLPLYISKEVLKKDNYDKGNVIY